MKPTDEFEGFFTASYPRVFRAVFAMCGDYYIAEEATQEAFARCLARWRRLRSQTWVEGWVMTTAFNEARRSTKAQLRRSGAEVDDCTQALDGMETMDARLDVREAILALPLREREAMVLHYFADYPTAIVAHVMQRSEGTVRSQLWSGRQRLRHLLRGEEDSA